MPISISCFLGEHKSSVDNLISTESVWRRQRNGALVKDDAVLRSSSWFVNLKACVLILLQMGDSLY